MARKYWQRAGLEDRIELRLQTAESTLRQLLDGDHAETFDFIFIDADKQNYPQYYEACMRLLRRGGLLAVDNTLWSGSVADLDNMEPDTCAIRRFNNMVKQDDRVIKSLVPIGDGLTLVYKLC
jgi:predicted O-methyltransferase YrrM